MLKQNIWRSISRHPQNKINLNKKIAKLENCTCEKNNNKMITDKKKYKEELKSINCRMFLLMFSCFPIAFKFVIIVLLYSHNQAYLHLHLNDCLHEEFKVPLSIDART